MENFDKSIVSGSSPHVPAGHVPSVHEPPLLLGVVMEPQLVPVRHVAAVVEARVGREAAALLLLHYQLKERAVENYLNKRAMAL